MSVEISVEKGRRFSVTDSPRDASALCTEAVAGTFGVEPLSLESFFIPEAPSNGDEKMHAPAILGSPNNRETARGSKCCLQRLLSFKGIVLLPLQF